MNNSSTALSTKWGILQDCLPSTKWIIPPASLDKVRYSSRFPPLNQEDNSSTPPSTKRGILLDFLPSTRLINSPPLPRPSEVFLQISSPQPSWSLVHPSLNQGMYSSRFPPLNHMDNSFSPPLTRWSILLDFLPSTKWIIRPPIPRPSEVFFKIPSLQTKLIIRPPLPRTSEGFY